MKKGLESRAYISASHQQVICLNCLGLIIPSLFQFHFTHGPLFFCRLFGRFGSSPPIPLHRHLFSSRRLFSLFLLYMSSYFLAIDLAFKDLKARR